MPRRWFQFRLKTLLIAVTLVAVAIVLFQRAQRFREVARRHEFETAIARLMAVPRHQHQHRHLLWHLRGLPPPAVSPEVQRKIDQWRALAAYHQRLQSKYERAAWLPFLPLPPDPPRPLEPEGSRILRSVKRSPNSTHSGPLEG